MSNNLTKINEFCANKYVIILILLKKNIVLDKLIFLSLLLNLFILILIFTP